MNSAFFVAQLLAQTAHDAPPPEVVSVAAVGSILTAVGGLVTAIIVALRGRTSRKRREHNSAQLATVLELMKSLNKGMDAVDSKVDGLMSRFDRHEASSTTRIDSLEGWRGTTDRAFELLRNEVTSLRVLVERIDSHLKNNLQQRELFEAALAARRVVDAEKGSPP